MITDEFFMKKALNLAKKGLSWTSPNPMVGAVVVKNGQIIGQGYHHKYGLAHAEAEALKSVKEDPNGATLYVNLEPCSHFGKTPPCAEAIIKSGIKIVVCSVLDPNPKVSGKGAQKLKKAGLEVAVGILEKEAKILNETFFTFQIKKRPFIALKFAQSLDGKIATKTGDSKWITNEKSRKFARKLRASYQAILVGMNTILKDDPNLGIRVKSKKDPVRIVLDSYLKIPLTAQVLRDNNIIIATTNKANQQRLKVFQERGIQIIVFDSGQIPLGGLMKRLYELNIISVLVEGGSEVLGSFVDERLVDKIYAFFAPIIIGGRDAKASVSGLGVSKINEAWKLKNISLKKFDDNYLISGYCK